MWLDIFMKFSIKDIHSAQWKKRALVVSSFLFYFSGSHAETVSYQQQIKPIFDKHCVVCHACFDAPCQLVLTHGDGLFRGANKQPVYNDLRASPVPPTRLHIDAQSTEAWQKKGFFSVLSEKTDPTTNAKESVLKQLLLMHEKNKITPNKRLPKEIDIGLKRKNMCPKPEEMIRFKKIFPHSGMPLGVTGMTDVERQTLLDWLAQGAQYVPATIKLTDAEQDLVGDWERFFNRKGLREQLVSRWLYEHLFMGHLYFSELDEPKFFQIVRSKSGPGKPIKQIVSRRPNADPGGDFYYRLKPVEETIVFKTHVVFALNQTLKKRINTLFYSDDWQTDKLPGYTDAERSNPFQTFASIPANARYRFMLDNAEYFLQTYIRGPVCHGQIATDVVRDQFWVMFQSPESDLYVTSAEFRKRTTPHMDIAGLEEGIIEAASAWFSIKKQYNAYSNMRQAAYEADGQAGASLNEIWDGDDLNSNALLSVFRHHDNVSVRKGLIGDYPNTVWWMDFPLLERAYYNLVANFDVFGSTPQHAQTRLFFDLIRNDAERNFLRLLPSNTRQPLIDQWYEGAAQIKLITSYQEIYKKKEPLIDYSTDDPKKEFLQQLLYYFSHLNDRLDIINRPEEGSIQTINADSNNDLSVTHSLRRIASRAAKELPAVKSFPEVTFIRVFDDDGRKEIYSVFRNRRHTNVAFMLGESLRRKPEFDTLTIFPGVLASYPNFIFNVHVDEINLFTETLLALNNSREFEAKVVRRWGVRRTHPEFWDLFHDLTAYLYEHNSIEAGIMDMGRYENL